MGGAPVFPSDLREARAVFPQAAIAAVYGSTEAEPMAHVELTEISEEDLLAMEKGSGLLAGRPVNIIALHIWPAQWGVPILPMTQSLFDASTLGPEQVGEIVVSGAHVLPGYLGGVGEAETKFDVDETRWHRTGDLGWLDERGRLWLMGRASATIRDDRGVLYPFAAECAAMRVPGVRRAAILQVASRRVLAIETEDAEVHIEMKGTMAWACLDEVRVLASIPMDRRHNAKVDYVALAAALSKPL
jgi:acyl-CoA synthetase (AMP-forming)/AMP-acid ligase II